MFLNGFHAEFLEFKTSDFIHFKPFQLKTILAHYYYFYNKNVTYVYFACKNTQNISIRSQSLTRWTTFLGHLPKWLYFDVKIITNGIQNWSIMEIMMHYCMLNERSVFLHSLTQWLISLPLDMPWPIAVTVRLILCQVNL